MLESIQTQDEAAIALLCVSMLAMKVIRDGDGAGYNIPEELQENHALNGYISTIMTNEINDPTKWEGK